MHGAKPNSVEAQTASGTSQNDRNKAQLARATLAQTEARQGVREAANGTLPNPAKLMFCGGVAEAENRLLPPPPPPKKLGADDDAPPKLHNEPAFGEERRGRRPAAWRTRTISNSAP